MEECTVMGRLSYLYWTKGHVDKEAFIEEVKKRGGPGTDELLASDVMHGRARVRGQLPMDPEMVGVHLRGKDGPPFDINRVFFTPHGGQ